MCARTASIQTDVFSNLSSVGKIASGGMGYVELARLTKGGFERSYAVKRLHPHLLQDTGVRAMFMDEARLAGLIRHPNVVSVLDVIEDERGPALVMEYIDGISLASVIELGDDGAELPLAFCLRMALEAARGLHAAHELRDAEGRALELVHRDVSPQNILLGRDGIARLTDFGVAKAMNRVAQTSTGVLKGKFGYMAPEILRFEEPDRRADLFALGVVLFESLTRERLYDNRSGLEGARRVLTEPPPDLADYRDDVPAALVALLFRLLAKERDARPSSAAEVEAVLEEALIDVVAREGKVDSAKLVGRAIEHRRAEELHESPTVALSASATVERRRTPWLLLAVLSLVVVLAGAWWWLGRTSHSRASAVATEKPPPTRIELPPSELSVSTPSSADSVETTREDSSEASKVRRGRGRKAKKRRAPKSEKSEKRIPMWDWE